MRDHILAISFVALALPQLLRAQEHDLEAQLRPYLTPPEMIMRFQRQLNISDDQRETIRQKITTLQSEIMNLQWDLQDRGQALVEAVSRDTVDLNRALEQLDRVLELESSIKKNHMRMLLEIRSILNPEQRRRLQELMEEAIMREMQQGERRRPEPDSATRRQDRVREIHEHTSAT